MKKVVMMTAVLSLMVFGAGCGLEKTGIGTTDTSIIMNQLVTKTFRITGFTWTNPLLSAKEALSSLDGIKGMTVETSGYTVITYDLTKINMDKIKDTLHKLNDEVTDEQEITRRWWYIKNT